jgi:hypothetical protein
MKKMSSPWTFAALALALTAPACQSANAQVSDQPRQVPIQHLAQNAMSAADRTALEAHLGELTQVARIYGYNMEAGNWNYEQTLCAVMPDTILLHYFQDFPNGTESILTALVPRGEGRVRIVPLLYHNATPFLPAPKDPRNYALFNELVPQSIAGKDAAASRNWLELSECYAELTGVPTNLPAGPNLDVGIAGAPSPTIYVDVPNKTTRVTFANREGERTYKIWSIAFNRDGKITAAGTEDRSVIASTPTPQNQPAATAKIPVPTQPEETMVQPASREPQPAAEAPSQPLRKPAEAPAPVVAESKASATNSVPPATQTAVSAPPNVQPAVPAGTEEPPSEPGWKFTLHPADPPSKIFPPAPPPPGKVKPEPPDPTSPQ